MLVQTQCMAQVALYRKVSVTNRQEEEKIRAVEYIRLSKNTAPNFEKKKEMVNVYKCSVLPERNCYTRPDKELQANRKQYVDPRIVLPNS